MEGLLRRCGVVVFACLAAWQVEAAVPLESADLATLAASDVARAGETAELRQALQDAGVPPLHAQRLLLLAKVRAPALRAVAEATLRDAGLPATRLATLADRVEQHAARYAPDEFSHLVRGPVGAPIGDPIGEPVVTPLSHLTDDEILDALLSEEPDFDCRPYVVDVQVSGHDPRQAQIRSSHGGTTFPRDGSTFLVLATGDPDDTAPASPGSWLDYPPGGCQGDQVEVIITFNFPPNPAAPSFSEVQGITFDFEFISDEFPEYVGSPYNDFAFGYLDAGSVIPDILADPQCNAPTTPFSGCLVTRDSAGGVTNVNNGFFNFCSASNCNDATGAPGWAGNDSGSTGPLVSCTPSDCVFLPAPPGVHTITLVVGDAGDGIFQSVALFDNMRCTSDPECDEPVVREANLECRGPVVAADAGACSAFVPCAEIAGCVAPDGTPFDPVCDEEFFDVGVSSVQVTCDTVTAACSVTVVDEEAPVPASLQDLGAQCIDEVPPPDPNSVQANDNCDPRPELTVVHEGDVSDGASCPETITRTYRVTDTSGNSATVSQMIVVNDTIPPVITNVPLSTTVECDAVPPMPEDVIASDNCDDSVSVTPSETVTPGACAGQYTLLREWVAVDACGNLTTEQQTIEVVDTTAPGITGVPAGGTVECDAVPPVPTSVTASDNCGTPTMTFAETNVPGSCPGEYTLIREWTADDGCGNVTVETQTLEVVDTTPPEVELGPEGETQLCVRTPNHWYVCFTMDEFEAFATDNCSLPVELVLSSCTANQPDDGLGDGSTENDCVVSPDGDMVCIRSERQGLDPEGRDYTVNATATDACGNTSGEVGIGNIHIRHDEGGEDVSAVECVRSTEVGYSQNEGLPWE